MKSILTIILTLPLFAYSQSLSYDRVTKIKYSTVRVVVNDGESVGSGFFINKDGDVVTCWHVINNVQIKGSQRIYIEFINGDTISMLPKYSPTKTNVAYDFFIISPYKKIEKNIAFYKLGKFKTLKEGEAVYTCGYTLGYKQQFITSGIVSTKLQDQYFVTNDTTKKTDTIFRDIALLDLTTNKGNSGGAIIKIGKSINEDEIVAIQSFIINPMADAIKSIDSFVDKNNNTQFVSNFSTDSLGRVISGNDINYITSVFAKALSFISIGITGSYSIDYLSALLKKKDLGSRNTH